MDETTTSIVRALNVLHSPTSTEQLRQQANVYLESFKSCPPPQLTIIHALITITNNNLSTDLDVNVVRHYGLLCIEAIIIQQWKQLNDNDKQLLKQQSIDLLLYCIQLHSNATLPIYVKNKFVAIAVQIILREYPQRYADLHEQLQRTIQQHTQYGTELVMLIYKSVCDEIVNHNDTAVPEKRRRDIQTSFINNMEALYKLFYNTLQSALQQYKTDKSAVNKSIVITTIDTIRYISEFINANYLFDSNIIELCCSQLNTVELYVTLMELLDAVIYRKTQSLQSTKYYTQIVQLFRVVCQSVQSLLNMVNFNQQHLFLHKTLVVLTDMLKLHSTLLHSNEHDSIKQLVLITLDNVLHNNKYDISVVAVELFTYILKSTGNHIILDIYAPTVIPQLVNTATMKLQKPLKTADSSDNDDDDTVQGKQSFGTYRGAMIHLLTALADKYPHHTLSVALNKYQTLNYNDSAMLDHINNRHYASTETTLYRYIEALGTMLDTTMRVITTKQLQNDAILLNIVEQLLHTILNHNTKDPLILTLKLHDISLFTNLYTVKPERIQHVLPVLFDGITFQSDVPFNDQHEDVRATRKRAIYSLITIGRKCNTHIQSMLTQLTDTVMRLVNAHQITDAEKILLYEFLITTSQAMNDVEMRKQFIFQLIAPSIQYITANDILTLFTSNERVLALLGANDLKVLNEPDINSVTKAINDTPAKQQRSDLLNTINTLISVYKPLFGHCTTLQPGDAAKQYSALSQVAVQLLPNMFTILKFMCTYRALEPQLPNELKLLICGSNEQLQIQADNAEDKQYALAIDVKRWLDRMMDSVTTLVSLLFKTGDNVYGLISTIHINESITNNIKHLHHFQLRHIHDKILLSLYQSCSPAAHNILLTNVTITLFRALSERYIAEWQTLKQQQSNNNVKTGNVANEMYEEAQLRESSHSCIDILFRTMIEFDHIHITENKAAQSAAPSPVNGMTSDKHDTKTQNTRSLTEHVVFAALMSHTNSALAILQLCNTMLQIPDTVTQHRAILVSIRLIVFLNNNTIPALLQAYIEIMHSVLVALSTIVVNDTNQFELDLIEYIKELYMSCMKLHCADAIISVLTQRCNVSMDVINNVNESLSIEQSEKKYRLVFKNMLRQYVVGKGAITGNGSTQIDNITETVPVHSHINAVNKANNQPPIDPTNLATLFNQ